MDLRGILNTSDNGEQPPKQPPLSHAHYQPQPQPQSPSTPSHGKPRASYQYDLQPHSQHGSPAKPPAQEFPPPQHQRQSSHPYPAQSPYQQSVQYPQRPAPPPLQQTSFDGRTPGGGSGPMVAPSPYRTPSTAGPTSAGYFPAPPGNEMNSPVQQHTAQFGPGPQGPPYHGRESYSTQGGPPGHPGQAPVTMAAVAAATSGAAPQAATGPPGYLQQQQQSPMQQSPIPQTPPVGTPGGGPHYLHQRSQSTHSNSTPTPTSAHSQHPYPPYGAQQQQPQHPHHPQHQQQQHSPVATSHPPPPFARQLSQPPTPGGSQGPPPVPQGPPSRHSSEAPPNFGQPSSPYAQRLSSVGPTTYREHPQSQAQTQNHLQSPAQAQMQTPTKMTSAQPPPPTLSRMPTDGPRGSQSLSSHSDRNRTPSISPKTRVSSLPGMSGQPLPPRELDSRNPAHDSSLHVPLPQPAGSADQGNITSAKKRKLEDRDMDDEPPRREVRPRQTGSGGVNGIHPTSIHSTPSRPKQPSTSASASPHMKRKKVVKRYREVPMWAQSCRGRDLQHVNYDLLKKHIPGAVNGKHEAKRFDKSRHASPEAMRSQSQPQPHPAVPAPQGPLPDPHAETKAILGPWEPTIMNSQMFDDISKSVADFLFINVLLNPDSGEIASRGINFEIEAKLGTLIDKDTRDRVSRGILNECLLEDNGRIAFQSSMTEAQHKWFNAFLNEVVCRSSDRRIEETRVALVYKHRYELDKSFDLPRPLQDRLPSCVLSRLRRQPKVRVTYDSRSGEVLAKIVKVRVADLNFHLPAQPYDCRISVNLEMDWDGSVEELEELPESDAPRQKDRLSYTQGSIQVDLTQVTRPGSHRNQTRPDKEHELEIELSSATLLDQGRRIMANPPAPNKYAELVESFVNNIRLLIRNLGDHERQP